ncbi:MAG: hypothetical protein KC441_01765 [Anaerolineales bacterium]|nr:hypothetical protein [Anaerolineales bacterium]
MQPPLTPYTLPVAEDLEGLLEMLYPDPPLVDILTLSDFKFRYRFSGLGAGAVAAIERAQRVTRAIGNYDQMGLSEFHNGLIYLHERQFLGALSYFAEARRYWDFENRGPAVCLAYFAQGIARQGAYHFERALSLYGKVDRCMSQFPVDDAAGEWGAFWPALQARLAACRESLLQQMRAMEDGADVEQQLRRLTLSSEPPSSSPPPAATILASDGEQPTPPMTPAQRQRPSPPPSITPAVSHLVTADLPIINLAAAASPSKTQIDMEAPTEPQSADGETAVLNTPIPDHQNGGRHLIWMKPDPTSLQGMQVLFPNIPIDAYILVDRRRENCEFRPGDLVIVNDPEGAGVVPVLTEQSPVAPRYPTPIFLGKVENPPILHTGDGASAGDDPGNGRVKLSPDQERPLFFEDIIGIVIGIWFGIDVQRLMGSR